MSEEFTTIISNTSYPSMMPTSSTLTPTPTPTFIVSNNNSIANSLMTAWVIIQIFFFLFLSFCIMTSIAYITRVKLIREIRLNQGINMINNSG